MRLKVELFSTFQRKARRRTAHQRHTRPRQVAHAAPLHRRRAEQPGDPANILPAALCQGDFEAYTFLETRRVCFSPATVLETYLSAGRCVSALRVCVCVCVCMRV